MPGLGIGEGACGEEPAALPIPRVPYHGRWKKFLKSSTRCSGPTKKYHEVDLIELLQVESPWLSAVSQRPSVSSTPLSATASTGSFLSRKTAPGFCPD